MTIQVLDSAAQARTTITGAAFAWPSSGADAVLTLSATGQGEFEAQASVDQGATWDHCRNLPRRKVTGGSEPVQLRVEGKKRGCTHLRVLFHADHATNRAQAFMHLVPHS